MNSGFWNSKWILSINYTPKGKTIIENCYENFLDKLNKIKSKTWFAKNKAYFYQENALAHKGNEKIERFKIWTGITLSVFASYCSLWLEKYEWIDYSRCKLILRRSPIIAFQGWSSQLISWLYEWVCTIWPQSRIIIRKFKRLNSNL